MSDRAARLAEAASALLLGTSGPALMRAMAPLTAAEVQRARYFDPLTGKANPGSQEAVDLGCICPVAENENGRGPAFWIEEACRQHGYVPGPGPGPRG